MVLRRTLIGCLIVLCAIPYSVGADDQSPPASSPSNAATTLFVYPSNHGFIHETGFHVPLGWSALYRIHRPAYFIHGRVNGGDILSEGTYCYVFDWSLLPGSLSGLFHNANDVVRVEAWDVTSGECLMRRTFQLDDLKVRIHKLSRKTLTFSTLGRAGHRFEPRVFWSGLSGVFLRRVELQRLEDYSLKALADKAQLFEQAMGQLNLDRGYVVVRTFAGNPEDVGDAAIWTGMYAATEAWRYRATHSAEALSRMQDSLRALHQLYVQSPVPGTLVRYVYPDGHLYPEPASKDTYTGFFFAAANCLPWVKDRQLKKDLQQDVQALADHFLDHDLRFIQNGGFPLDFNPYLSHDLLLPEIKDILQDAHERRNLIHSLKLVQLYFWTHAQHPWPELSRLIRALKKRDGTQIEAAILPVLNGSLRALHQLQKNVNRSARANGVAVYGPYGKLNRLLLQLLLQVSAPLQGKSFQRLEDIKILSSPSLHALHFIKVAGAVLPKPNRFDTFYQENLWQNKALLKTALEWDNFDEELSEAVLGQARTGVNRTASGHLSFLALYDLIELENDPTIRFDYRQLFERQYQPMQDEYNAFLHMTGKAVGMTPDQIGVGLWSLMLYPTDRRGRGEHYWQSYHKALAARFGGDVFGQARDPLPLNERPRDPFIWQRIARSLRGDNEQWLYPPLDYLYVYWLARASHQITDQ